MKDNQEYKNGRQLQIEDYLQENMLKTEVNVEVPSILATSELEERAKDDDEYVPIYILDINEDIESMFEESITDMIIDK